MIFHKHNWVNIKETYALPVAKISNVDYLDKDILLKLILGVTTILWECSICKATKKEEMLGKEKE